MEARLNPASALYLYGIITHPATLPACDAVEDGTTIDVIAAARIGCVVSPVPARAYDAPATGKNAAEQLAWVAPRAMRHHEVVRRLHSASAMIPLKFGTVCASADHVRDMLARCEGALSAMLGRLHGRDEWTLSIRLDADRVLARLAQQDPELRALGAEILALPEGRAYFARKKHQQRAAALLAAEQSAAAREVYARVIEHVDECCEGTAAPVLTLLVDRERFAAASACLAALESEQAANGLSLELGGPWAPYSFVSGDAIGRELTPVSGIGSPSDSRGPVNP